MEVVLDQAEFLQDLQKQLEDPGFCPHIGMTPFCNTTEENHQYEEGFLIFCPISSVINYSCTQRMC